MLIEVVTWNAVTGVARGFKPSHRNTSISESLKQEITVTLANQLFADMATAYATLIDLPNELLTVIIHKLSTKDRLSLARLCRRLNHVALSYQLYDKDMPYSSFGSHSRDFSDLRHFGLYLTTEPPFSAIKLAFTGGFVSEMAEVQHYLDIIPYDPPAFHVQFLPSKLLDSYWSSNILEQIFCFYQSLVRWKCLSLVVPFFEARELDRTISFDVPALTTLQMATFTWPKSDRLTEWFVQCINESPIEVLCISHEMILDCPSFLVRPDPQPMLSLKSVPHLTSISGSILLLSSVLSSTDAFPRLTNVDILKKDFCWRGSQDQTEEMQAVLHLMSRIPSIRQLTAPLIDLVETALKLPPRSAPAIPHINRLFSTEPELAQDEGDILSRLFPNLTEHRKMSRDEGHTHPYCRYFWPMSW
ncbi:hypothetical protein EDD18DRAFT_1109206 [Armillaria luteobubalina]|uniref:F-box domain-containing protein n=1 Tax=Armillaria luteobubalina TaxID=153913 RepID=A0AA39UPS8_9AGAR|nr:hypothetical protein EDD18DRAFT_1109206 [Armillaria luteobubalina]